MKLVKRKQKKEKKSKLGKERTTFFLNSPNTNNTGGD